MSGKPVSLNLASRPRRNRRFLVAMIGAAAVLFAIVAALAAVTYGRSLARTRSGRVLLARADEMARTAEKERETWLAQSREWAKLDAAKVEAINGVILKKSFSWIRIFALLEEALPDGSSLASMAPLDERDGRVEMRFKVVSQSLSDLLVLIQKLDGLGFKNVSVRNETPAAGQWVSEISLSHERTP